MKFMNSFDIQHLLITKGFTIADVKTHVIGLRHESDDAVIVYLKDGRGKFEDERKPVFKQPLVLHPDVMHLSAFRSTRIAALGSNPAYKNDNMSAFPKEGARNIGVAVDVPDEAALNELLRVLVDGIVGPPSADADIICATDLPVNETERRAVIAARRGQGVFRSALMRFWSSACAVSNCTNSVLLRASHIQPWRDSSNIERLSPDNGLLLVVQLDAAFDRGLISFNDDGNLIKHASRLSSSDAQILGLQPGMKLRRITPEIRVYLAKHRTMYGFS